MKSPVRRMIVIIIAMLPPTLFLTLVWALSTAEAEGIRVNWEFTRWILIIFGTAAFLVTAILATLLYSFHNFEEERAGATKAEEAHDVVVEAITIVITPPAKSEPFLRPDKQTLLIGAVLAGMIGGMVVLFSLRRRDKRA